MYILHRYVIRLTLKFNLEKKEESKYGRGGLMKMPRRRPRRRMSDTEKVVVEEEEEEATISVSNVCIYTTV